MSTARADMRTVLSADATQFHATMRKAAMSAKAVGEKMGRSMLNASKAMGRVALSAGKAAAKIALIGGAIAAAFAAKGIKDAYDLGGALSDLSAQTGIAVRELVILKQAFEDNGVSGDKVGSIVNKMQRAMADLGAGLSTQVRAFDRLGLSYEDLERNSPLEQFEMIQKRIAAIDDPTLRAATAMEIFGRSGGEMLALFSDVGAIGKASTTIGSAADILDRNAQTFDRISDLMNSAGGKLQQFALGIAEVAAPKILDALEKFNAIDFASIGQRFAKVFTGDNAKMALATMAQFAGSAMADAMRFAFEAGYRLFRALFSFEGLSFIGEGVYNAFRAVGERLAGVLVEMFDRAVKQFTSTWDDVANDFTPMVEDKGLKFLQELKDEMSGLKFELSPETKSLFEDMKALGSGDGSTASAYDAEREEQRKRVAADMAASQAVAPTASSGVSASAQARAMQISTTATNMVGHHQAGFSGLAERSRMQLDRMNGVGVGTTTSFAKDRARLGIGSGLTSGGIGAKRAVGRGKDEEAMKRQAELAKSSEEHLMDIKETIGKSLTVSQ